MLSARQEKTDVVVIGGGAGGMSAAVSAARLGARVVLVEQYGFLGGAASNSQVLAYCGFYQKGPAPVPAVLGIGAELLAELEIIGQSVAPIMSRSGNWIVMLDPEAVKFAFDRMCEDAGVQMRLHSKLTAVTTDEGRITSVTLADHAGTVTIEAGSFIDASGEATLSMLAGARLTSDISRGDHTQPASMPVRIGGVAPDAPFDRAVMAEIIARYNAISATPIPRVDGGVMSRLPISGDVWWMTIDLALGGVSGEDLCVVEREARQQAWRNLGLIREMPGFERAYLVATGPQIGIRESRRPQSLDDMTGDALENGARRPDGIGRAAWPMEVHEAPGRANFIDLGGEGFADIPVGALQAADFGNLYLAGRVIGAEPAAYGSIRVMGTAFATGHAAGITAALGVQARKAVPEDIRRHLLTQNALI
ncbi:FAD-dependent oxidoreductase [Pseudorhizobium flavum]|uniref:FAD-dependent oxidoreductase n=1 Tax=Pseudorhizobium flavum TaxID=1335061 RepID=UPI0024925CB1|nr:FAD-dependent oxidoreductase [Pseudorhizobium flavum]